LGIFAIAPLDPRLLMMVRDIDVVVVVIVCTWFWFGLVWLVHWFFIWFFRCAMWWTNLM
jgi:hypothetical protein